MRIAPDKSEIWFNVAYYGPGLSGKTTSLRYVYEQTPPDVRSAMRSVATEMERTLQFDLASRSLAPIAGKTIRARLITVPGAVFYHRSKRLILDGVDGVIFVADSQVERIEANLEGLESLAADLESHGVSIEHVPMALQYNKCDLPNRMDRTTLDEALNHRGRPAFETVARLGVGIFDTLKAVAKPIHAQAVARFR